MAIGAQLILIIMSSGFLVFSHITFPFLYLENGQANAQECGCRTNIRIYTNNFQTHSPNIYSSWVEIIYLCVRI